MIGCSRCRRYLDMQRDIARYGFPASYGCESEIGNFNVTAANLILRLAPREPQPVSARSLDQWYRMERWHTVRRHLPHVDKTKPGIVANLGTIKRQRPFLIEGLHRAENHRRDRTDWSCYFLTPEETYAIFTI